MITNRQKFFGIMRRKKHLAKIFTIRYNASAREIMDDFKLQGAEMFRLFNSRQPRDENIQVNTQSNQCEQPFKFRSHLFSTTSALMKLCYGHADVVCQEESLLQSQVAFKV
jgi:hypothetical protein